MAKTSNRFLDDVQAFAQLHEKARQAGLECLDTEWSGRSARYRLRCSKGHEFTRLRSNIVFDDPTCAECANIERLAEICKMAEAKGGRCLESEYLGNKKYRFVCAQGHEWAADTYRMKRKNSWCPHCVNIERSKRKFDNNGLERLQRIAAERGGKCLSDTYLGTVFRHRFECALGHTWETIASDVIMGRWCRFCAAVVISGKRRLTDGLERLQRVATAKGGECISTEFTSSQIAYRFRCARGHEWDMDFYYALRGNWCGACRDEDRRSQTLQLLQKIAHERGGKCLSKFVVIENKMQWECHRGHQWWALPGNVRKGHWCQICSYMDRVTNPRSLANLRYRVSGRKESPPRTEID